MTTLLKKSGRIFTNVDDIFFNLAPKGEHTGGDEVA